MAWFEVEGVRVMMKIDYFDDTLEWESQIQLILRKHAGSSPMMLPSRLLKQAGIIDGCETS